MAPTQPSEPTHKIPPRASVPAATFTEEEMFGTAYNGHVVRRFVEYVRPYRLALMVSLGAVLIFTVTQVAIPLIVQYMIDEGLAEGIADHEILMIGVGLFFGVIFINYIANFLQQFIVSLVAQRILFDLRRAMYNHLQRISLSFMDKTEVGRLMSRLQGDVGALQEFLETAIFAIGDLVLLFGIIGVLLVLDLQLGLLTLALLPVLLIIRVFWLPHARKAFVRASITSSIVTGALCENIRGVRVVQGMAREQVNFSLYEQKARDNLNANIRATKIGQIMLPTVDTLTGLAMGIIVITGGSFVLSGQITAGVMVAFMLFVQRFFDPIRALTMHYNVFQKSMVAGERIFAVLDVKQEINDKPNAIELKDIEGSIEFEHVTFGYEPERPILKDITFRVEPGETVAFVGPTGSGKTSTMALINRFYEVWEGSVKVGGVDVRDVTQESLGHQVAMVLQEPFLFSVSIFENIRYRKEEATRKEVIEAAKTVGAHDFIMKLPHGYETILEERGSNLSLGQQQLISFARALVMDAKILVLDEATASVDSYTEMLIQQALKRLLEGRTAMVIAHRLATIREADRIVVLRDGALVESGNHDQLIEQEGLYARLYSMQYASFDDIPEQLLHEVAEVSHEIMT